MLTCGQVDFLSYLIILLPFIPTGLKSKRNDQHQLLPPPDWNTTIVAHLFAEGWVTATEFPACAIVVNKPGFKQFTILLVDIPASFITRNVTDENEDKNPTY
jgi:hypothetical protein